MNWVGVLWAFVLVLSSLIYSSFSGEEILLFGNIAKIFALLAASLSLTLTQNAYAPGDTPQKAWGSLASGMWIWFFAQLILGYYKIVLFKDIYPSIADLCFMVGYAPLLLGLIFLINDYRSTGLPMGSRKSYLAQIGGLLVVYLIVYATLLHPLLTNDDPLTTKLVNLGYPTFDFIVIGLTSVLLRITIVLRGGILGRSWIALAVGFVVLGAADIAFAYKQAQWIDILFFSAYFLVALSGTYQLKMLRQ